MSCTTYPSDLTDAEWRHLEPLLPTPRATGRPRQWPLRLIVNGIFYLVRSGCAWRMLPKEYPPWPTVHYYYRRWRLDGTWERIHTQVRQQVRQALGRQTTPSGAVLDSQSIKTTEKGGLLVQHTIGFDGLQEDQGTQASSAGGYTRDWCSKSKPQALISLNAMELTNCWSL
jgi:transposase